jgi:hypothetical protein
MIRHHLRAQLDALRLGVHQRDLRRREQDALARLGKMTLAEGGARGGRLSSLAAEAASIQKRLESLSAERRSSAGTAATRADLQRRREPLEQKLREVCLTAGRLAMAMPATGAAAGSEEVQAIRAELANTASEQARLRAEGGRLGEELVERLRAWVTPRAPALVTAALGWWIASRYTESHLKAIMKSLGMSLKPSGAHLVSASADRMLIEYGVPLIAAVLCAKVASRVWAWGAPVVEAYRERAGRVVPGV